MLLKFFRLFYFAFIFLLCFSSPAYAYLDPGTTSLLLSSAVAVLASVLYFLKTLFYKLARGGFSSFFAPELPNKQNAIVIYSEGKQYFGVFKPIVDAFEKHHYPYTYYTSDENDPILQFKSNIAHIECIGQNNRAYARLNTLSADIVLMTTPQLDILQIKKSKGVKHYCHILHSPGLVDSYEIFALDCFDSVFTNSIIHTDFIREVEHIRHLKTKQIEMVGLTYMDYLNEKLNHLNHLKNQKSTVNAKFFPKNNNNNKTILIAPSWGRNALFAKYGMKLLKPLCETKHNIIIRAHPQSYISQADLIAHLQQETQPYSNCVWDKQTDNIDALSESDCIIGDFSGVLWDYLLLFNKPILVVHFEFNLIGYDLEDTSRQKAWSDIELPKVSHFLEEKDFENIEQVIENAFNDKQKEESRNKMKELLWQHPGKSGENTFKALLKIRQNLLKESLGEKMHTYEEICALENLIQQG